MNPFDAYLKRWSARIDEVLDRFLPAESEPPATLHRAMRYTLFAGGKRIRPILTILAARAAGGREEDAFPAASAVEMVHAFSLIHDDLPAMDDDDLRRGKPTCHKVFGEGIAVLAGDGLLNLAFATLARLECRDAIPDAVAALARAVGSAGLIGGQVEDLEAEGAEPDIEVVDRIHLGKTAALLEGCARLGAIAAGAGQVRQDALGSYGRLVGQAFQIVDDILDETGGDDAFGKTAGKDRAARKMTYPAAVGLDRSRARAAELAREAVAIAAGLPGGAELAGLAERVVARTH